MDLNEHLARIWSGRYIVVAIAISTFVAVFAWRSEAEPRYQADATLQIRLPQVLSGDPASQATYLSSQVAELATSASVLTDAFPEASPAQIDDLQDDITAEVTDGSGFVRVAATADDAESASDRVTAVVDILSLRVLDDQSEDLDAQRSSLREALERVNQDRSRLATEDPDPIQAASLDRERDALLASLRSLSDTSVWRLGVVEPATVPTSAVSPQPVREASVGGIVALILGAELMVLLGAARGRLSTRDPAGDASKVVGVPAVSLKPESDIGGLGAVVPGLQQHRTLWVVRCGRHEPVAAALTAELFAARGERVLLIDASPGRRSLAQFYGLPTPAAGSPSTRPTSFDDAPVARGVHVVGAWGEDAAAGFTAPDESATAGFDRVVLVASINRSDELWRLPADPPPAALFDISSDMPRRELKALASSATGLGFDLCGVAYLDAGTGGLRPVLRKG